MRGRAAGAAVAALFGVACAAGSRAGLMSWPEYSRLSPRWPYVIRLAHGQGALLYYGARHTYAPSDPQIDEIERLWSAFQPTLALNEGGHPPVRPSRELSVEKHGEAGWLRFLAARDDVPVTTLDPSRSEEVAHLRRTFPAQDVKLFFLLRAVSQFGARGEPGGMDAEIERVLGVFHGTPGLGGEPRSVAELAALYERRFPGRGTYRDIPASWFDPTRDETWLNAVSRASSDYRDGYMIALLARLVGDGQRVFAVVGGSHVVMQERALRACVAAGGRGC